MTTPTPPTLVPPTRFFASYFDVVKYPASPDPTATFPIDNWAERWQWIVMPHLPESHPSNQFVVFNRHQNSKTHRAIWRSNSYDLNSLTNTYAAFLHERKNRVPRDPIVVELSLAELKDYIDGQRRTPWEVIKRAQRAARRLGYTI